MISNRLKSLQRSLSISYLKFEEVQKEISKFKVFASIDHKNINHSEAPMNSLRLNVLSFFFISYECVVKDNIPYCLNRFLGNEL